MGDQVLRWDVLDGGRLGAVITCSTCDGLGGKIDYQDVHLGNARVWVDCEPCSGSGELFRAYELPQEPDPTDRSTASTLAWCIEQNERSSDRGTFRAALTVPYSLLPRWFIDLQLTPLPPKEPSDG